MIYSGIVIYHSERYDDSLLLWGISLLDKESYLLRYKTPITYHVHLPYNVEWDINKVKKVYELICDNEFNEELFVTNMLVITSDIKIDIKSTIYVDNIEEVILDTYEVDKLNINYNKPVSFRGTLATHKMSILNHEYIIDSIFNIEDV